jgi:hypothetical protein
MISAVLFCVVGYLAMIGAVAAGCGEDRMFEGDPSGWWAFAILWPFTIPVAAAYLVVTQLKKQK